ncbi:hypothetical protein Cgig2_018192 [Carnegiea gigantea]|uniref:SHSP domain-containing protein n=1 Tax=Carnegiea gigantea TaxID=171969 RepID=A0A9Q1QQI2_9CARY|nr:hypothetical protein Cgig2_018192 [Carnegiea gigantea]
MSMGSRGGSRSRHGVRPVYEEFKPMSEWKHEDGAKVLLYHLPGFVKEQIRILAESKRILRIFGERFVGGNKWSRFQEEVAVPEDCNMTDIRARFEGGILQIIMPQKTITKPTPTHEDQPGSSAHESPKTSMSKPDLQTKEPQKLEENASTSDPKQTQMQEDRKRDEILDDKSKAKAGETHLEAEMDTRDHKDEVPNAKGKKEGLQEKKEAHDHRVEENTRANKSSLPRSLDEDRQLLVNMGVAVLVIVGLGAYILYSFSSSV